MKEKIKFEIALEIISIKISEAIKNKDRELANQYLKEKEEIYLGNWEIIEKVLNYK